MEWQTHPSPTVSQLPLQLHNRSKAGYGHNLNERVFA